MDCRGRSTARIDVSWLTNLATDIWGGLTALGKTIVNTATPVAAKIVDTLRRGVQAVEEALKKEFREPPSTERERLERELQNVNEQLMRLRKRRDARGELTDSEKRQVDHLLGERAELAKELDALDQATTAEDIVGDEEKYQPVEIDAAHTHILQYHVGQFTHNKSCRVCGREMFLQSRRDTPIAGTRDFFWACVGYYDSRRHCEHSESLNAADLNVFVNVKRPDFELSPEELSKLVLEERTKQIRTAMRDVISRARSAGTGVEGYRCPVHKERLVLREKGTPSGFLDQFFLGCPRHDTDGKGCNYVVKIKSPAQFGAVFDATGEGSLIQVAGVGPTSPSPANHGKPWTPELVEQMVRAYEQGVSVDQIANIFQRSTISIYLKLQGMGKLTPDQVAIALGRSAGEAAGRHTRH